MTVLVWCSLVKASGGSERIAASLASGLTVRGNKVLLVGPYGKAPRDLKERIHPDIRLIDYHPPGGIRGLIKAGNFLRSVVRAHSVDVISAHGNILPVLRTQVPVLWTEHAIRYPNSRMLRDLRAPLWRMVRSRIVSKRWRVVCVSNFVWNDLSDQMDLPSSCGKVIYNGIADAAELSSLPAPRLTRPFQIGFVGRLDAEKHPDDIFELSRLVEEAGIPCEWHVFGEGEMKQELCDRAGAEGSGRVHVHGYVKNITDAFRNIDAVILPSHLEGLPTVVLEARIARRLIFAWKVGGVPEAAGEHGVLVDPPFDLDRLAAGVVSALAHPRVPPPSSRDFEFDRMVSEYAAVLEQMV
jgi:glycosyltransferase involved in cell wall biosynthesis